jgi:hypothetical protein
LPETSSQKTMTDPIFIPTSLATFSKDIDEVGDWLTGLGLSVDRTRLQLYRRVFDGVIRARISGRLEQFAERFPPEVYSGCFSDVSAIRTIKNAFPKTKSRAIRELLKRGAKGAGLLRDEKPDGNKARDHLFQLLVASYFRHRGIPVFLNWENDGIRPDVIAKLPGFSFDIECKRLQSSKAVLSAVKEAMGQLEIADQRFARKVHARRLLIVLDVSKLCFTGGTLLEFYEQSQYVAFVEYAVTRVAWAIQREIARHPIPPWFTILIHLSIPAFLHDAGCLVQGVKLHYCSTAEFGSSYALAVQRLVECVGPAI